jgi:hypothetical protein
MTMRNVIRGQSGCESHSLELCTLRLTSVSLFWTAVENLKNFSLLQNGLPRRQESQS